MEYRCATALCLMLVAAFPLQAAVYQWTDEHGQVHFSDRPTGESATEKTLPSAPGGPPQHSISPDRKEKRQKMLKIYEQERMEKREAAEKKKAQREQRRRQCHHARARYEDYRYTHLIYDLDKAGERKYLDEQQRKQFIAELKADVERYCH